MKERILSQLYGIQIGDPDSDAYLKRIIAETAFRRRDTNNGRHSFGLYAS